MGRKKLCIICGVNEVTVPDRNYENIGRMVKKVCGECHGARLRGDMVHIMECHRKRREAADRIGR